MFLCTDAVLYSFQGVWVCMYTRMHMCFCVQTNLVSHAGICCPSPREKQGLLPSQLPWYLRWNMLLSMKWFPCKTPGCWGQGVFVGYTGSAPESMFCLVVTFNLDLSWDFFLPVKSGRIYTLSLQLRWLWQSPEAAENSEKTEGCWAARIETETNSPLCNKYGSH